MTYPDPALIPERIMAIMALHVGRVRAITRDRLRAELRVWNIDLDDRELRRIYAKLPLCSGDEGLWIAATSEEVEEFRFYLLAKIPAEKARERVERVYRAYPRLAPRVPVEQGKLSFEGERP